QRRRRRLWNSPVADEMVRKSLYTCRTEFDVTGLSLLGRVEGAVVSLRTDLGDPHLICVKGEGWRGRIGQSIKPVNIVRIKDQGKWTAVNCGNVVSEEAIETDNVQDGGARLIWVEQEHIAWCQHGAWWQQQVVRKH